MQARCAAERVGLLRCCVDAALGVCGSSGRPLL